MKNDSIGWQAFRETGDPIYYLLYKAVYNGERRNMQKYKGDAG